MRTRSAGNACLLLDEQFGGVGDFPWNHAAIAHGKGDFGRAIVEHQAAGVELVVGHRRQPVRHAAIDGDGKLDRCDVLSKSAGTEDLRFFLGLQGGKRQKGQNQQGNKATHTILQCTNGR